MRMKRRIFEILFTEGHLGQFSGPFASNFENMVLTRKKLHNDAVTSKVFPITYYNAGEKKPSTSGEGSKTIQVRLTFDCELEIDKLLEHIQSTGKAAISFERRKRFYRG